MRVLVLTSCTGEKACACSSPLALDDFDDPVRLREREEQLGRHRRPAAEMYTGQQHVRAMRGVRALRDVLGREHVDVAIISAGYGLLDEQRLVAPYDVTFQGMSPKAIRQRAARLAVPAEVRARLPGHDLVFLLLGSSYLAAVDPPLSPLSGQRLVYFAKPDEKRTTAGGVLVPAGRAEATLYGAGLVALKGRMLELLGAAAARQGSALLERVHADATPSTVTDALTAEASSR